MITTLTWLGFTNGMSHLETAASTLTFIFVIFLAPTRFWGRTATTSARFRHGYGGIDVPNKEQHCYVGNIPYSGSIIVFWNLCLIEEDVLDCVRNIYCLAANRCIDVECYERRRWLGLLFWRNLRLGRCHRYRLPSHSSVPQHRCC